MGLRKAVPWVAAVYLGATVFAGWGFAVGRYRVFPASLMDPWLAQISAFLRGTAQDNRTAFQKIVFDRLELPRRHAGFGFSRRDPRFSDPGFLLNSRFDKKVGQVIVDLVRMRDFEVLHTWRPPLDEILRQGKNDLVANCRTGYRAQHPLLLPGGDLVFSSSEGPLVRIDRDSRLQWLIDRHFHHSIEMDTRGNLFVPCFKIPGSEQLPPELPDEIYAVVSPQGKILEEHSVSEILLTNGYSGLLLGASALNGGRRLHLNDVQPMSRDIGATREGDVALSLRNISTVLLYRPSTGRIVWLKTGPWLHQHDISLLEDGRFSVFDNHVLIVGVDERLLGDSSQVCLFDPETGAVETPYADVLRQLKMWTNTGGRARVLPNGDVYIDESDYHRLLRTSRTGVRWEFVNGVTEQTSGAVNWSRYLLPDEIDLSWLERQEKKE